MKPQSRPGCNPGGGSFAPGWSLYSLPGLFSVPPQATPGRWTERKSHSPGMAAHRWTQPPRVQAVPYTHAHSRHRGRTEPRNRARVQGHRQAPKQATEPPTEGAQAQAIHSPGQIPPKTPINAPQSRPGWGCYPYTTRRQNAAQGRTEPPTEGKPPGVQKRPERPERRRPCPALLYHAKALIGQPRSGQIFERFSVIFPGSVPLCL